ncbi:MAG TPA: hypothetical protein VMG08_16135 [Allosphingosinicella sp.]|nr:hypothetical protein [Allosphingosinicella sp.]
MSISEWELWACAQEMIRQHGPDAAIHAAMKANFLLFDGDREGASTWCRIVQRINQLEAGPRDLVH